MTAFTTHSWKKNKLQPWLLSALLWLGLLGAGWAQSTGELESLSLERREDGVYLSANLRLELGPGVEEALFKGVPVVFTAEAQLLRPRWYWYDKKVSTATRYLRLAFQPLLRRWRLQVSSSPLALGDPGLSLVHNFDALSEAMAAIRRVSTWKIADASDVDVSGNYSVDFRFQLDQSQLPRVFQIGTLGQGEWNILITRSQRLPMELVK
jgi:hypothetical protein